MSWLFPTYVMHAEDTTKFYYTFSHICLFGTRLVKELKFPLIKAEGNQDISEKEKKKNHTESTACHYHMSQHTHWYAYLDPLDADLVSS